MCQFPVLEVPQQHKNAWAAAWGKVLTRWEGADSDQDKDRALMWLGFLSQALLRKPSRGGRAGRREVAKRFECVIHGDWENLVALWTKDSRNHTAGRERGRNSKRSCLRV